MTNAPQPHLYYVPMPHIYHEHSKYHTDDRPIPINQVNGKPTCGSEVMNRTMRDVWGFQGCAPIVGIRYEFGRTILKRLPVHPGT